MNKYLQSFLMVFAFLSGYSQNKFENGVSPSSYRIIDQTKLNTSEYNHLIFQSEDMSALNFFGNPLEDINGDGKVDVMMRVNEYLTDDWDLPSGNPRLSVLGNFDKNLNFAINKSNVIIADGNQYKFFSDATGDYYFQFTFQDFTFESQFGLNDWKSYYSKYGFTENQDYFIYDGNPRLVLFNFRIYRKRNGIIEDVTLLKRKLSESLSKSTGKIFWQSSIIPGDFDGDLDLDFLVFGEPVPQDIPNLTTYRGNKLQPYFIENLGDGSLNVDMFSFNSGSNNTWSIQEGSYGYASNFDSDVAQEALLEMTYGTPMKGNVTRNRELGFFDVDKNTREIRITKLLDKSTYLLTDNSNIGPRFIQKFDIDKNRDLILIFNTDQAGSPFSKIEGETSFTDGTIKQYLKVFEKIFDANKQAKLVDVTTEFFDLSETKTLSLDNAGTMSQIDVDSDGLTDIFLHLGQTPNSEMGGIKQFIDFPSWNGKYNTMYYFKQTKDKKFKLTNLFEFPSVYFPSKFDYNFKLFDDNGYTKPVNGKDVSVNDFVFLNNVSLNDLDNDGNLEFISATDPSFISVFTKSKIKLSNDISKIQFSNKSYINDRWNNSLTGKYSFDNSKYQFSSDTIFANLDPMFKQYFELIDPDKVISHQPTGYFPVSAESNYSIKPPMYGFKQKLNGNSGRLTISQMFAEGVDTTISSYVHPYVFRVGNDLFVNSKKMVVMKKNIPPISFEVIRAQKVTENSANYFEVDFENSVDLNGNKYVLNNQENIGVRYGYELYEKGKLVLTKMVDNIQYATLNGVPNRIKIQGFRIALGSINYSDATFKIFALDNQDEKIKTFATISTALMNSLYCPDLINPVITVESNGSLSSNVASGNQWYFNGVKLENQTLKNFTPTLAGSYTLKVSSGQCVSDFSKAVSVVITSAEEEISLVGVYPNPVESYLNVIFPKEFGKTAQVQIVNIAGMVLVSLPSIIQGEQIDISHLSAGNYIVHINSNDNSSTKTFKVSKIK